MRHRALRVLAFSLSCLSAAPSPAQENGPPPEFFAGLYDGIGRWDFVDGGAPEFFGDTFRLDPARRALEVRTCAFGTGSLRLTRLHEEIYAYEGEVGGSQMSCAYHVTGGNYPLLTCGIRMGPDDTPTHSGRLTLWPRYVDFSLAALSCGD